jgi:hypothetical protein
MGLLLWDFYPTLSLTSIQPTPHQDNSLTPYAKGKKSYTRLQVYYPAYLLLLFLYSPVSYFPSRYSYAINHRSFLFLVGGSTLFHRPFICQFTLLEFLDLSLTTTPSLSFDSFSWVLRCFNSPTFYVYSYICFPFLVSQATSPLSFLLLSHASLSHASLLASLLHAFSFLGMLPYPFLWGFFLGLHSCHLSDTVLLPYPSFSQCPTPAL